MMRRWFFLLFLLVSLGMYAQTNVDSLFHYDRASLCVMMISRPEQLFDREIEVVFKEMNMPERFNDHSLGPRVITFAAKGKDVVSQLQLFAQKNEVAKKMVAKWFHRDRKTGGCDIDLVLERGLYNVRVDALEIAQQTMRGKAILTDAGDKLIKNTYLVVCDYSYTTQYNLAKQNTTQKDERLNKNKQIDASNKQEVDWYNDQLYATDSKLTRFTLICHSYLFRLDWNDEVANLFYYSHYTPKSKIDPNKVNAFNEDHSNYRLTFVAEAENSYSTRSNNKMSNQQLIKKACIRLLDNNLATLQHLYADFRIKSPIVSTQPLKAYIGAKEDVNPDAKYEVLMPEYKENGTYTYQRVGIVQPIAGEIWDNRYMLSEEQEEDQEELYESRKEPGTLFKQISGSEIVPGMLLREMVQNP